MLAHPELVNKPDDDERLPIHWAATVAGTTGSIDLLNKLSQAQGKKFDIDATDSMGWSILHIGASLGEKPGGEEVVTWAIARGGDVSLKSTYLIHWMKERKIDADNGMAQTTTVKHLSILLHLSPLSRRHDSSSPQAQRPL